MPEIYRHLPTLFDPVAIAIGSFSVRWYSLMYLLAFFTVYILLKWRAVRADQESKFLISNFQFLNNDSNPKSQFLNLVFDWIMCAIAGLLIGARLGHGLFYNSEYYFRNPLTIVWPFSSEGSYVGIFGMSYFGGLLGVLCASWIFTKQKKINFLGWADFVIPAVPAGYFFGRIGNFLNGELYGTPTFLPWGMDFGNGIFRHPTQLYEALLEGIISFFILWLLRNRACFPGQLLALYAFGYGLIRFGIEFLRESRLAEPAFGALDLSQLFSLGMVSGAVVLYHSARKRYNKERLNP